MAHFNIETNVLSDLCHERPRRQPVAAIRDAPRRQLLQHHLVARDLEVPRIALVHVEHQRVLARPQHQAAVAVAAGERAQRQGQRDLGRGPRRDAVRAREAHEALVGVGGGAVLAPREEEDDIVGCHVVVGAGVGDGYVYGGERG